MLVVSAKYVICIYEEVPITISDYVVDSRIAALAVPSIVVGSLFAFNGNVCVACVRGVIAVSDFAADSGMRPWRSQASS